MKRRIWKIMTLLMCACTFMGCNAKNDIQAQHTLPAAYADDAEPETDAGKNGSAALNDRCAMLFTGNALYTDTGETITDSIAPSAVIGNIACAVDASEKPLKEGQSNFGAVGAKYARRGDDIAVLIEDEWYRFEPVEKYGVLINSEQAYRNFLWESTYTEHGWLAADGMSVSYMLPELIDKLPQALFDKALLTVEIRLAAPSVESVWVDVYDSSFERIHHRVSEEAFWALAPVLPAGEYYVSYIVVSRGEYVESEGMYEQLGEEYLFRVTVPKEEAENAAL